MTGFGVSEMHLLVHFERRTMSVMASSPFAGSAERLRALQRLCRPAWAAADDDAAFAGMPDALVLVGGQDSRFSVVTHAALRWLLLGAAGPDARAGGGLPDAALPLEEAMIVVVRCGVRVYMPQGAGGLLPAHEWRNARVWAAPAAGSSGGVGDDADGLEAFKMRAFVEMVAGCARVGMPLTPGWNAAWRADMTVASVRACA